MRTQKVPLNLMQMISMGQEFVIQSKVSVISPGVILFVFNSILNLGKKSDSTAK